MKRTCTWILASALVIGGCNRQDESGSGGGGGGGGNPAAPTAEQMQTAQTVSGSTTLTSGVLTFSDMLFHFDPDLNPDGTAASNTDTIRGNLGDAGCAHVTVTSTTSFSVDFGSGCTIGNVTASGQLDVDVSLGAEGSGHKVGVDLAFHQMVVNGFDVDGTASFATFTGYKLETSFDVTHAGAHDVADLTVVGAAGYFTVSGSYTTTSGSITNSFGLSGVEIAKGDCWPRAGSVSASTGNGSVEVLFDSQTATTGLATLEFSVGSGTASTCFVLPNHGSCVAMSCPAN